MNNSEAPSRRPVLSVSNLSVEFTSTSTLLRRPRPPVKAVNEVSFAILEGETLGLVGESGCGKTTVTRAILRVVRPTAGIVSYVTEDGRTLTGESDAELGRLRREVRMIFQDPYGSLNPRMTVEQIVAEPLMTERVPVGDVRERVVSALERVGLSADAARRYPHAFSGGQRQRIGIARALVVNPRAVLCDEAVSALDVSVRAQILNLLLGLQRELHLTYLFVSHDLAVVRHVADRIAVMYAGSLVEVAPSQLIFASPRHPYTEALLSAIPIPDPTRRGRSGRVRLTGEVANPADLPPGCPFHPRCRFATAVCAEQRPRLRRVGASDVACHHAEQLSLTGR